jgi:uncharacterized Zn finger protein
MSFYTWKPYVSVAQRRANAEKQIKKLAKTGNAEPVCIQGRTIAGSVWGKGWCTHLEKHSDFENRLPRGRSYVRNGSVYHLAVKAGRIEARVMGSAPYEVAIHIDVLKPAAWKALKSQCAGEIGSLLELLQGRVSDRIMSIVTDRDTGLFPKPGEMTFDCSCPDWAGMCKHVAAVLYGVGHRLDTQPALLFQLRGVNASELITESLSIPRGTAAPDQNELADDALERIFGVEIDDGIASAVASTTPHPTKTRAAKTRTKPKAASRKKLVKHPEFRPSARSVRRLRKQLGLSVSAFAKRLSVSAASVNRWETEPGPLQLQARCLAALTNLHRSANGLPRRR